jgi:hypothetical protein
VGEVGDGAVRDSESEDGVAELELEEFRWRKGIMSPSDIGQ